MIRTVKKWIPKGVKESWQSRWKSASFNQNVNFEMVNLFKELSFAQLTDTVYLEHHLIPELGLNNESLHEFPQKLLPFCGKGLFIWQYPNQLAPLLSKLSEYPIENYLEVGARHGGMFAAMVHWLHYSQNKNIYGLAVDITVSQPLEQYVKHQPQLNYWVGDSQSTQFKNFLKEQPIFDLTLIDADHSYTGCLADFNAVKDQSKIILFHDIVSDVCPGVVEIWSQIKQDKSYTCFEFTNQYKEIEEKGESYLGIGMAVNNSLIKTSN